MAMERSFREYGIRAKVDVPRKVRPNPIKIENHRKKVESN
jgi:hypothetical protein